MNCDEAIDLIVDSLMDSLDDEQRGRLEAHLAGCETCTAEARAMRWSWNAMARLEQPAIGTAATAGTGRRPMWLRVAAAVALFLAGSLTGFVVRGAGSVVSPSAEPTFLLLVRGTEPDATVPVETLVQEYSAWAASLADEGRLVAAEKLANDSGRWVSGTSAESRSQSDVSGYFVIVAPDYTQAVEIARSSPHVRYGGTFEIRRIDPLE